MAARGSVRELGLGLGLFCYYFVECFCFFCCQYESHFQFAFICVSLRAFSILIAVVVGTLFSLAFLSTPPFGAFFHRFSTFRHN